MPKPDTGNLRPWPFITAAIVCFTSGTALISEEGRTAAGEALIIMGIILLGSWITLVAAQSPIEAVRGWRHKDDEESGDDADTD